MLPQCDKTNTMMSTLNPQFLSFTSSRSLAFFFSFLFLLPGCEVELYERVDFLIVTNVGYIPAEDGLYLLEGKIEGVAPGHTLTDFGHIISRTSRIPDLGDAQSDTIHSTILGQANGQYITRVSGLESGEMYYYRAYAFDNMGESHTSMEIDSFRTPRGLLTIDNILTEDISLRVIGSIKDLEAETVCDHGIVWSTSGTPSLGEAGTAHKSFGSHSGDAAFNGSLEQDFPNDVTFTFRAYARYKCGGEEAIDYSEPFTQKTELETDFWEDLAGFPNDPRIGGITFTFENRQYFGFGGNNTFGNETFTDFWVFDTSGHHWVPTSAISMPAAMEGRVFPAHFTIGNTLYVGTGRNTTSRFLNDWWKLEPGSDQFEAVTPWERCMEEDEDENCIDLKEGTPRHSAYAVVVDGKAYIGGGVKDSDSFSALDLWCFDPSQSEPWTLIADQDANLARFAATVIQFPNEARIIFGRRKTMNSDGETLDNHPKDILRFFKKDGNISWNTKESIKDEINNEERTYALGAMIGSGNDRHIYVGMGLNADREVIADWWLYDPSPGANGDAFTRKECRSDGLAYGTAFSYNRIIYVGNGRPSLSGANSPTQLRYIPEEY